MPVTLVLMQVQVALQSGDLICAQLQFGNVTLRVAKVSALCRPSRLLLLYRCLPLGLEPLCDLHNIGNRMCLFVQVRGAAGGGRCQPPTQTPAWR